MFSAANEMLDSVPGTLMLSDCLDLCQSNDTCKSVNYETGLCILFTSNADKMPGKFFQHRKKRDENEVYKVRKAENCFISPLRYEEN